jgi:hypothetical protein
VQVQRWGGGGGGGAGGCATAVFESEGGKAGNATPSKLGLIEFPRPLARSFNTDN